MEGEGGREGGSWRRVGESPQRRVQAASSQGCRLLPSSSSSYSRLLQVFVESRCRQEGGSESGDGSSEQRASSRVLAAPSSSGVEAVPISATARASSFRRCELEV